MNSSQNQKKAWAKPFVQSLDINKDTFAGTSSKEKEVGKGGSANIRKSVPS